MIKKDSVTADDAQETIGEIIAEGLEETIIDFEHIFATVNLNEQIDKNQAWAWCNPSYIDYAYINKTDKDKKKHWWYFGYSMYDRWTNKIFSTATTNRS
ncbi:TULIP family P47-like protein (plasmid) [Bacillus toyonensis]